jgi:hypothetical protein
MKSKKACQTAIAAHPDQPRERRTPALDKDHLHARRSRCQKPAPKRQAAIYHSRTTRPAVISQVVDTVALVRTLVGDVYYRNDSMNCDHQVLAVCFMAFAVSLRGCFGVGCTHVKSTKEEKKSSRSAELLWARRLDHNLSRAHEA